MITFSNVFDSVMPEWLPLRVVGRAGLRRLRILLVPVAYHAASKVIALVHAHVVLGRMDWVVDLGLIVCQVLFHLCVSDGLVPDLVGHLGVAYFASFEFCKMARRPFTCQLLLGKFNLTCC